MSVPEDGGGSLLNRVVGAAGDGAAGDAESLQSESLQRALDGSDPAEVQAVRSQLQRALSALPGGDDSARSEQLLGKLLPLASALDQVVWGTWANVAPRSPLKRTGNLSEDAKRFLDGREDETRVTNDIDRLRQLTAAMISAVGLTSRRYAEWHHRRFSPDEIESLAKLDRNLSGSGEAACWRKYQEMSGTLDEASIEADLHQELTGYVEPLLK